MKTLLDKIAGRLSGINSDDCTTAERQIAKLLIESGHLYKDDNGDLRDEDAIRPEMGIERTPANAVESTFIQKVEVTDPDTRLQVEVEIRKMASGPMVGFDGCFLDQLGPGENPFSPYDDGKLVNVPDDEE